LSAALIMLTFIGPAWRRSRRIDRRSGDASALIASRFSPGIKVRKALVDFGMILSSILGSATNNLELHISSLDTYRDSD